MERSTIISCWILIVTMLILFFIAHNGIMILPAAIALITAGAMMSEGQPGAVMALVIAALVSGIIFKVTMEEIELDERNNINVQCQDGAYNPK